MRSQSVSWDLSETNLDHPEYSAVEKKENVLRSIYGVYMNEESLERFDVMNYSVYSNEVVRMIHALKQIQWLYSLEKTTRENYGWKRILCALNLNQP